MNKPIPAGIWAPVGANLVKNPPAKCRAGESDCVQKAQGFPGVMSRKTATTMRVAMTALLQLCIVGIWLYGACRLFGQAHPVLAGARLLVMLCQICTRLTAGKKRLIALPQDATRFPRQRCKSTPWHSVRHTLMENDFNERVSVIMPSTEHVYRHAERSDKESTLSDR